MNQTNNHLRNEDLSAYLDRALNNQEYAMARKHLQTCDRCSYQLTQLKMTTDLLRRAKVISVPRNFTLDKRMLARKPARSSPWQIFSAAAAVLGLTLLLFGAYSYINFPNGSYTGAIAVVRNACGTENCSASSAITPTAKTPSPKKPTGVTTLPVQSPTAVAAPSISKPNQQQFAWWIYGVLVAGFILTLVSVITVTLHIRR